MVNNLVFDQDMAKPVNMRNISGSLYENDDKGLRLRVRVFQNGAAITLSGSIVAHVVRANGTLATVGGSRSGNEAYVNIPKSCLMPGLIQISMKNVDGSVSTTILAITGVVKVVNGSAFIDSGGVIPSLASYEALVQREEAAAATINGLSTSATLIAGDRYRCNVNLA